MNNKSWKYLSLKESHGYLRCISDGHIFVGLYMVMFGWRVRCGYLRDISQCCDRDYCAGDRNDNINWLYNTVVKIAASTETISIMPLQDRKPINNDPAFVAKLYAMSAKLPDIKTPDITLEELEKARHAQSIES